MAPAKQPNDMFTQIDSLLEAQKIWADLAHASGRIYAKIGDSDTLTLAPQTHPGAKIFCTMTPEIPLDVLNGQELVGQFSIGGEKYFFKTHWVFNTPFLVFPSELSLYRLQRRQNFRLKIPKTFHTEFHLERVNSVRTLGKVKLWDLSSRGCCLLADPPTLFKANDTVSGIMTLAKRDPVAVQGVVRHLRTEKIDNKLLRVAGVEFNPMSAALESQLFNVMMELSRLYLRVS